MYSGAWGVTASWAWSEVKGPPHLAPQWSGTKEGQLDKGEAPWSMGPWDVGRTGGLTPNPTSNPKMHVGMHAWCSG